MLPQPTASGHLPGSDRGFSPGKTIPPLTQPRGTGSVFHMTQSLVVMASQPGTRKVLTPS